MGGDVQVSSVPGAEWKCFPSAESTCFNGDTNGFAGKKPLPAALHRAGGRHVSVSPACTPGSRGGPSAGTHWDGCYRVKAGHLGAGLNSKKAVSLGHPSEAGLVFPKFKLYWLQKRKISVPLGLTGLASPEELLVFLGKTPITSRCLDTPSPALQKDPSLVPVSARNPRAQRVLWCKTAK